MNILSRAHLYGYKCWIVALLAGQQRRTATRQNLSHLHCKITARGAKVLSLGLKEDKYELYKIPSIFRADVFWGPDLMVFFFGSKRRLASSLVA